MIRQKGGEFEKTEETLKKRRERAIKDLFPFLKKKKKGGRGFLTNPSP